ncbi:hypothetical protein M409DRAFT_29524 [Zasmidium cellare ATCC 36951]|uniref:Uncharacterized protein n=1 Tax=Zasmidium cellare ATCC 36951 TaxID=1080233 RepID=A0A6A6BYY3_ZASCE|nr:uncharacterized protein M409DRAFT_29524 [Zasmidium cellare ATCC 36951]KAF2159915.1 hypothetical protein M409DRAFT_29524 [Zasmidium cellare ATCC 36951]
MFTTDEPLELRGRKFSIDRIGRRRVTDGIELFEVHWSKTEVPRCLITRNKSGSAIVRCDGKECEVLSHTQLQKQPDELRLVDWKPSWLSREELQHLGHEPEPSDRKDEDGTPSPRKRRKRVAVQEESSADSSTAQSSPSRPEASGLRQAKVKKMRFQPKIGKAYTHGIRKLLRQCDFGSLQELVEKPTKNEIVFRDRFVEKGSFFNALERKCRHGAMLQLVGAAQLRECAYCSRGNGPFDRCVVLPGLNMSACGNCVYGGVGKKCNYHVKTYAVDGPWSPRKATPCDQVLDETDTVGALPDPPRPRSKSQRARTSGMRTSKHIEDDKSDSDVSECAVSEQLPLKYRSPAEQETPRPGKLKKRKREVAGVVIGRDFQPAAEPQASSSRPATTARANREEPTEPREGTHPTTSSPHTSDWRTTNYLTPGFRHEGCPGAPSPCQHFLAGCQSPESEVQAVERGRIFKRGEASPEEVRWLIRRSDCSMTELMSRAWLHRLGQRKQSPLPKGCTKESFLSQWHPGKISRAAALFGTGRSHA